jgi:hypothetical protein
VPYPVAFEADYIEHHSRAKTFFRSVLAIPLLILAYLYGIVAGLAVVVAWFAIVITGHYPAGLYRFVAGFVRYFTRATAYYVLLTDEYPAFGGEADNAYPVRMHFDGPLPKYSRLRAFFRGLLEIPILFLRYAMTILLQIGAVAAWFVILVTGRLPRGLFDLMVLANSYIARSDAYVFLLTQTYPPFQDEQTRLAGVPEPA